ncbi:uncharacterized protein K02A2.6-like [Lineus longissimus]|uniref:uncharacterized protein K02A2.6-like n=1 Tax=Lineus longissimus TaxID=88925 RepID=UPI00315D906B
MDIEEMAKSCSVCTENARKPAACNPTAWQWPSATWKRIHIDFAGPFLNFHFFVVVDAQSKWVEIEIMRDITSVGTIRALRKIFARFGLPEHPVSDNGSQFTSAEFQSFLKANNIRHMLTAPGHPATNGQAERLVGSFKDSSLKDQSGTVEDKLQLYLLSYRTTPQCSTGKAPCELLMRRSLRTRLSAVRPSADTQPIPKEDPKAEIFRYFKPGQPVFARNYITHGAKWLPGVILERHRFRNYQVSVGEFVWKRHIDQLRTRYAEVPMPQTGDSTPDLTDTLLPGNPPSQPTSQAPTPPMELQVRVVPPEAQLPQQPRVVISPRRNPPRERKRPEKLKDFV